MQKILVIEGMSCGHCKARVEKVLNEQPQIEGAVVDLEAKTATFNLTGDLSDEQLKELIDDAGYDVLEIK